MNEEAKKPDTQEQNTPVVFTEDAIEKIKSMMKKEGKEGCGLRFGVSTGGCAGLSYDMRFQKKPYENDIVFEQSGLQIFINPQSIDFVRGTHVDYLDTLKVSGFQYKNPNAQNNCGCGTSFS